MLGVRLEPELEERLQQLAVKTGRSKSFYARQAIAQLVEDHEDALLIEEVLKRNEKVYSVDEVRRELGLEG
jgi:RHH-type rel operon transcriptional repressor/antitoxin RelB